MSLEAKYLISADELGAQPATSVLAALGDGQMLRLPGAQARGLRLVMIDCPPSLGTAVIYCICAAGTIVIPATSDAFSLKGVDLTLLDIAAMSGLYGVNCLEQRAKAVVVALIGGTDSRARRRVSSQAARALASA